MHCAELAQALGAGPASHSSTAGSGAGYKLQVQRIKCSHARLPEQWSSPVWGCRQCAHNHLYLLELWVAWGGANSAYWLVGAGEAAPTAMTVRALLTQNPEVGGVEVHAASASRYVPFLDLRGC
jgi:hypothetical protein